MAHIQILDGGMGTCLWERGFPYLKNPSLANLSHPWLVQEIHKSYLKAGADLLTTNTFQAGSHHLKEHKGIVSSQVVAQGVELARRAGGATVALSVGPSGIPLEQQDQMESYYRELIQGGRGADLILLEGCLALSEAVLAVTVAKEHSPLPIWLAFILRDTGTTYEGETIEELAAATDSLSLEALGLHCSLPPKKLLPWAIQLTERTTHPVFFYPMKGLPQEDEKVTSSGSPEEFARELLEYRCLQPLALGGCCGTTPEEIRVFANLIKEEQE